MLDVAIIGGGPAGLTAGLYTTRGGLKEVVMFEPGVVGGQITGSSEIENYPGHSEIKTGMDFMSNWLEQCSRFGLKYKTERISRIEKVGQFFKVFTDCGKEYDAKSVIIGTGSIPRKAGFEGEEEFFGRGISTCATCDGFFYKNQDVAIIGGGNTAIEEAIYLSNICRKVYVVHRNNDYNAAPITVEHMRKKDNIEEILNTSVVNVVGDKMGVTGINLIKNDTKEEFKLDVPGVFTFVGRIVLNEPLKQEDGSFLCDMTDWGEVVVNLNMETSVKGLYAVGDIRKDAAKQVVCAAGDGATAAVHAVEYINNLED